jgi:AmiR/NasT family two-component response regulator
MSAISDQLPTAVGPIGAIAEAVHILMARHGITEDAAIDLLVRASGEVNARVRETAARIVAGAAGQ